MNRITVNEKNFDKVVSLIMTAHDKKYRCTVDAGRFFAILQVDTGRWRVIHPEKDRYLNSLDMIGMLTAAMNFLVPKVSYETKEDRAIEFHELYSDISKRKIGSFSLEMSGATIEFIYTIDDVWDVFEPDSDEYSLSTDAVLDVLESIKNNHINLNGVTIFNIISAN